MIDADAFRERLKGYAPGRVREMLAEGRFGEDKIGIVQAFLADEDAKPIAMRTWPGHNPTSRYQPSAGDRAYRNAFEANPDLDPFEEAVLLQKVSPAYLSALAHDNSGPRSAAFKAMIDAEVIRRGSGVARRANNIAFCSLLVAVAAAIISIFK